MNDTSKQLPNTYHQGYCYFDVNTGKFWIDTTNASEGRMAINANHADNSDLAAISIKSLQMPYIVGTGTAAVTTSGSYYHAKWEATLSGISTLETGIYFVYKVPVAGNSTYGVGLRLNSTGDYHPVICQTTTAIGTRYGVGANILLMYDATAQAKIYINNVSTTITGCWVVINDYDSGNTVPSAYCSTDAGTSGKTATCSGYTLLSKSFIHVIMTKSNSYSGAITLNINGKGSKPIYINGAASSSSNKTLPAGSYLVYYDGTKYYFRTDGKLTADITGNAETASTADVATTANKVNHKLTIGTFEYDGSADVTIPVYSGSIT